ncbi:MAG: serine hydrolase domain-containing protein [Asticcacaulis sp.]|uniref:serine hydrolase domain-containing protein n=1 Tax=Asticcacaulis sp. TaxID=1872648 RepID=UPI0039E48A2F
MFKKNLLMAVAVLAIAGSPLFTSSVVAGPQKTEASDIKAFLYGLRPSVQYAGEKPVRWTLEERMKYYGVPGVSIAVIRDGKIAWARGFGVRAAGTTDKVDADTVFSVGSLSKVPSAAISLRLVNAGRLDLDTDISPYLKRWKLPQNPYTGIAPVTLRGLLSHSAGMNLNNFPDFLPGEPTPTIVDTLNGTGPVKTGPLTISYAPGHTWRYSGGGVEVEQLLIEDVTGLSFPQAAQTYVLGPLGMTRSTFVNPLPENYGDIAYAHDASGKRVALPRGYETFPEMAASGLWTTPTDYARFVIALMDAYHAKPGAFLNPELGRETMTETGVSPAGLGPFLSGAGMDRRFFHTGANDHYRAWMEGNLATGNGMMIFTNGANGSKLYAEIRRAIEDAEGWTKTEEITLPRIQLGEDELKALAGVYAIKPMPDVINQRTNMATAPVTFNIAVADGGLTLTEDDEGEPSILIPEDHVHFVYDGNISYGVEFVYGYDGKPSGLIFRRGPYSYEATRVK